MMMHPSTKYKKCKKAIALTLVFSLLNSIFYPTYTWALTPGPSMPEYASFEPVDATDMVSLLTGDFTYALPIINVPGPQGGYSLSMFYHAGISPEQEASWVGLGWNINPGSINRFVNGVPDDWKAKNTTIRAYSGSQVIEDWKVGVSVTQSGVSVGLSVDGGTNRATGGTVSLGRDIGKTGGASISVGTHGVGVNGSYGQEMGSGYGVFSAGVNINESGQLSGNVAFSPGSSIAGSLGVSFSSQGAIPYMAGAGYSTPLVSSINNKSVQSRTLKSIDVSAIFPVYSAIVTAGYNYSKTEYWKLSTDAKYNYGTLYMKDAKHAYSDGLQSTTYSSDFYENPYNEATYNSLEEQAKNNALSFPSYDNYQVTGQGIGGNMSPRINEYGTMVKEGIVFAKHDLSKKDKRRERLAPVKSQLVYYNRNDFTKTPAKTYFQFDYDPSGYSKVLPGKYTGNGDTYTGGGLETKVDGNPYGPSFYNQASDKMRFGKSKYIEWFKNSDIVSDLNGQIVKGFIESESQSGQRNSSLYDPDGIGAFSITAEDGKTYHYSIPVYQFESFQFIENKSGGGFLVNYKPDKFAYNWLLTSITGPDYVDRGTSGMIDDEDYGYWVKFDYGKWTDGFQFRTPYQDGQYVNSSEGQTYGEYHIGRKQIYYLNSIKTKTHTAYFIKDLRKDGKGQNLSVLKKMPYSYVGNKPADFDSQCYGTADNNQVNYSSDFFLAMQAPGEACQLLKLDKIVLVKNSSGLASFFNNNNSTNFKTSLSGGGGNLYETNRKIIYWIYDGFSRHQNDCYPTNLTMYTFPSYQNYYQHNVLDVKDINGGITTIEQKALKIVQFNQNYSLCTNTPNSNSTSSDGGNKSKLTLNSVKIYGLGKADVLPSYNFSYKNSSLSYNKNNLDNWGYYAVNKEDCFNKPDVDAWSLNEITTPLGGKIKINYESDLYSKEAISDNSGSYTLKVAPASLTKPDATHIKLKLEKKISELYELSSWLKINESYFFDYIHNYGIFTGSNVTDISTKVQKNVKLTSMNPATNELIFEVSDPTNSIKPLLLTSPYIEKGMAATIQIKGSSGALGGGLRVKEILTDDGVGNNYKTSYTYNYPNTTISSGITSYAPRTEARYIPYLYELPGPIVMYEYVTVEDKGITNDSYLKTRYRFDVVKPAKGTFTDFSMGEHFKVKDNQATTALQGSSGNHAAVRKGRSGVVTDNKSAIGRILEVVTLNKSNLVQNKVSYEYEQPEAVKHGVVQETFNSIKRYISWFYNHNSSMNFWSLTASSKIQYPSVLKSITEESNGIKTITTNTKFDFYTGIPTETKYENSAGEKYYTKAIPAYEMYGGIEGNMGSKIYHYDSKNMLAQSTANYLFADDAPNNLLTASIQTWNKTWKYREYSASIPAYANVEHSDVWRKHETFVWKSEINANGTLSSFTDFDWSSSYDAGWQKTSEVTLYDHYSQAIESKDINDNYSSVKKGGLYNNFVIASSGSSNYESFFHSSFEDQNNVAETGTSVYYFGGEVKLNDGIVVASNSPYKAHTGDYLVKIPKSFSSFTYGPIYKVKDGLQKGKTYRASVWVHKQSSTTTTLVAHLNSGTIDRYKSMTITNSKAISVGDWKLLTVNIDVPSNYSPTGGTNNDLRVYVYTGTGGIAKNAYIDDMRLQPVNSPVTGYVYEESTGLLKAILDNENFATLYTYDGASRLIKTEKETAKGVKKVSETTYHYGRP